MMNTRKYVLFGLIAVLIIGVTSWLIYQSKNQYEPQTYNVNSYLDMALGGDIEKSVGFARDIVFGHYVKHEEEYHMGSGYWGDIYTFKVEETLLGHAQDEIQVLISHYRKLSETIDGHLYEADVPLPDFVKPDMSKKYIVMLAYLKDRNIYSPAVVPNHIELDANDIATLKFNPETTAIEKNKRGDQVIFTLESADISQFDKITGLSKDQILHEIKKEIVKKQAAEQ
ncbi:hypothetical protein [Paenibacillus aquistagni]|uniref:hypothetical protein n=1 Tax=Paenibacillus aquistagni TaxID=1852522 RepID=UPI000B4FF5FF|nr:hypothetical protein [Paenibacillus aquistagni]